MISYEEFETRCRDSWRYAHDEQVRGFLAALTDAADRRVDVCGPDRELWRAQVGCGSKSTQPLNEDGEVGDMGVAYPAKRMKPTPGVVGEGRLSPRGITVLYTSTDTATAISEVRPHKGAWVSVSEFRAKRPLRIVDCAKEHAASFFSVLFSAEDGPTPESVWKELSRKLAAPIWDPQRTEIYVPTQIVGEYFRRAGYDGIEFKSALGPGSNVAIFDVTAADPISGQVLCVDSVTVKFSPAYLSESW